VSIENKNYEEVDVKKGIIILMAVLMSVCGASFVYAKDYKVAVNHFI